VDQKWRDALNVAAAEPTGWGQGSGTGRELGAAKKEDPGRSEARKLAVVRIHVAVAAEEQGPPGRLPKKSKFAEVLGSSGLHPPWRCGAFGDKKPEERAKIIEDNKLCTFCLLHDKREVCYS
jgi:hypothetical protein